MLEMTLRTKIECLKCGKVTFGSSLYPEDVGEYTLCPVCGNDSKVLEKELVPYADVETVCEGVPAVMIDRYSSSEEVIADGKGSKAVKRGRK